MTITRDRSISFPSSTTGYRVHSWEAPSQLTNSRVYTAVRTLTGTRLPKWHTVIVNGGNATTAMSAVLDSIDDSGPVLCVLKCRRTSGETLEHTVKGDAALTNNGRSLGSIDPSKPSTAADNLAKARFYKKLYSASTKFQGLTFVGELREALHMLRRPARALWDSNLGYLSALGKRKRGSPKHWTKTISGLWLEHSFGWTPLINDCKDAVKAYEELVRPNPKPVVVSGGGRWEFDRTGELDTFRRDGYSLNVENAQIWSQDQCRLREEHIVRYKGAVRAQVEAPHWRGWDLFGFTPQNLIPTAWELLPWSFLVDYFTNIGDILQASVTSTRNLTYVNRTEIRKTRYTGRMFHTKSLPVGFTAPAWSVTSADSQDQTWDLRRKLVNRSANSGISLPTLQLSASLSDGQLFNVAALLGQARALHPQRVR